MRPVDRLPEMPTDATIIHELGHLLVGLEIGVPESGIEFLQIIIDEIARAHYLNQGVEPWQKMVRGFAGMCFQLRMAPQSVDLDFGHTIIDGRLFVNEEPVTLRPMMAAQGFVGDWDSICFCAGQMSRSAARRRELIQSAFWEADSIIDRSALAPLAQTLLEEIKTWLNEDNPNINAHIPLTIIYGIIQPRNMWRDHLLHY